MFSYSEYVPLFTAAFGLFTFLVGTGWISQGYLNRKFNEVHANIEQKISDLEKNIIQKLEYHERHDDKRFAEIRNDVWDIRVRNAARDGLNPLSSRDRDVQSHHPANQSDS